MQKTLGQKRIGNFNSQSDSVVDTIKTKASELIDYINDNVGMAGPVTGELQPLETLNSIGRLKSLALTDIESASMWAVKAHMHLK